MTRLITRISAVAIVLLSAMSGLAPVANAQGLGFYMDDGRGPPPPRGYDDRYDYRRERMRDNGCSPRHAMEVADYFGLRRARIVDVSPRRVVIDGVGRRGERTRLVLANNRGCDRLN